MGGSLVSTRQNVSLNAYFLWSLLLLCGAVVSCALSLAGPIEPASSLVIGRVVVNNKYPGDYGILPQGILREGLEVLIGTRDGSRIFKVTTEEEGYFLIPNIPPDTYYVLMVNLVGTRGVTRRETESLGVAIRTFPFTAVPGKIGYIGTVMIDLSELKVYKVREVREYEIARAHFLEKHRDSTWASREFIALAQRPVSGSQGVEPKPMIRP
jgi:hypothetical protein